MVSRESRLGQKYKSCNQSQTRTNLNKSKNLNEEAPEEDDDIENE